MPLLYSSEKSACYSKALSPNFASNIKQVQGNELTSNIPEAIRKQQKCMGIEVGGVAV